MIMKIKEGFLLRNVAGNYVIVPVGDDAVEFNGIVTLNESGKFLWDLLENEITKEELLRKFMEEYNVPEETAKADIKDFMQTLLNSGIVEV